MMPSRRFLVLHGWQNHRPAEHWQWQLVESLRSRGEQVLYPQLPAPDHPSLAAWADVARAELAQLGDGERVVIAHSLSVALWLHLTTVLDPAERVDRTLLVAPPSPAVLLEHEELATFAGVRPDADQVAAAAGQNRLVCSDADPYCPEGASTAYAGLGLDVDVVVGGRHLDLAAGYGAWPSVLDWCLDPSTRLTAR